MFGFVETMKDLMTLIRTMARRTPWRVVAVCGSLVGLSFVIQDLYAALGWNASKLQSIGVTRAGLALCFVAGLVGGSRGRAFDEGVLAVFFTIVTGFTVAMIAGPLAVLSVQANLTIDRSAAIWEALDVPLPVMLILGGTVGGGGAAIAAWLRSRPATATA